MKILAIDTTSETGSAVIRDSGRTLAEVRPEGSLHHSQNVFKTVERVLAESGIALDAIDVFAAARGPGSFTGLRIGMSAVEGFAFATGKKTAGISTLSALAWAAGHSDRTIATVLDAGRGEIYGAAYRRQGQELIEEASPAVLQPAEWVGEFRGRTILFCGPGVSLIDSAVTDDPNWDTCPVPAHLAGPIAEMIEAGHHEAFEPLYVRPTSAEVNRLKR